MNKKILVLLCFVLVAVIGVASVLYNGLADKVNMAGLATVATVSPSTESAEEATVPATEEPDYSAPNFSMEDWDGNVVRLADFVGKPVILNFWASWCSPCKSEMPEFEEAYKQYGEEIHFIMLNCTISDAKEDAKALITENGYTFPVYFDTTGEASYGYGASSIPLTFFIDAEGNLVTYAMGALSGDLLQKGIDMINTAE